jgi:hypothetical protein
MKNSIAPFILLATYVAAASTTNGKQPVGAAIVLANDPSGMNTLAISTMEESGKLVSRTARLFCFLCIDASPQRRS